MILGVLVILKRYDQEIMSIFMLLVGLHIQKFKGLDY